MGALGGVPQSDTRCGCSLHYQPWHIIKTAQLTVIYSFIQAVYGCTRWQMGGSGFASGMNNLYLGYPAFAGYNGTFYIDSRDWAYACSTTQGGLNNGVFDFFELEGIAPWTEMEDTELLDICRTSGTDAYREVFFGNMPTDYHDLQVTSAIRVSHIRILEVSSDVTFRENPKKFKQDNTTITNVNPSPPLGFQTIGKLHHAGAP